jgi:hypothetical protein
LGTYALTTTRCLFQTQNLESLDSRRLREPLATGPKRCRNKFLRHFPDGFSDQKYIDWERGYKWAAHQRWQEILGQEEHRALILPYSWISWPLCATSFAIFGPVTSSIFNHSSGCRAPTSIPDNRHQYSRAKKLSENEKHPTQGVPFPY